MTDFLSKTALRPQLPRPTGFIGKYLKRVNVNALIDPKCSVSANACGKKHWSCPVSVDVNPARRVCRLTERSIDKHGNVLLLSEYVLGGWTTMLPEKFDCAEVIALYCDYATHEQVHSEFKIDMDLERLPSGKFDTNYQVCQFAAVAMNPLRLIGQNTLNEPDAPRRHAAKRRRMKTVMQELMSKAARMITLAGRWALGLGVSDPAVTVFERHYAQLRAA